MSPSGRFDAFGSHHPIIPFLLMTYAIVASALVRHPAFLAVSLACAAAYYLLLKGRAGLRLLAAMAGLFVLVSAVNPLVNTMGETVLFTYAGGRPYTLEALCYGMATAAMLVAMMLWFSCFNAVMTSDAVMHLMAPVSPALSLVLTMTLRLIPLYQRKASDIAQARACIGRMPDDNPRARAEGGAAVLGALTSWAFESAVTTADSMRSRGFATGTRTTYARYRFDGRDALMLAGMLVLAAASGACMAGGAAACEFIPAIVVPSPTPLFWAGLTSFGLLLSIPSITHVGERALWRYSLSKI